MTTGNELVDKIGEIAITGNIIPQMWYETLKKDDGKPYFQAIVILADIVYWYKPVEVRDEKTGRVVGYKKNLAQICYKEHTIVLLNNLDFQKTKQ